MEPKAKLSTTNLTTTRQGMSDVVEVIMNQAKLNALDKKIELAEDMADDPNTVLVEVEKEQSIPFDPQADAEERRAEATDVTFRLLRKRRRKELE